MHTDLEYITPVDLRTILLATPSTAPEKVAIIDVRDHDHIGGHIFSSTHVPSTTLPHALPELVRKLEDKEKVIFHCALSSQRGPDAARGYAQQRRRLLGNESAEKQKVLVLQGGFVQWAGEYGKDERLTEGYRPEIWEEEDD